jgi:hypothetical protein
MAARPKSLAKLQAFGGDDAEDSAAGAAMQFGFATADHAELLGGLSDSAPAAAFAMSRSFGIGPATLKLSGRIEHSSPRAAEGGLVANITDIYAAGAAVELRAGDFSFAARRPTAVVSGAADVAVPGIWSRRFSLRENPAPEFDATWRVGIYSFGASVSEEETMVMMRIKKKI